MLSRFLTEPGDLVVDIFSGSNTTGYVAEKEQREWISFDSEIEYVAASAFRFLEKNTPIETLSDVYESIKNGHSTQLSDYWSQMRLIREESVSYEDRKMAQKA